jgi:hypothetical protein
MTQFPIVGTLLGGLVLSVLNWLTAAILPPRYKQFREPQSVVETIRANVVEDDIYTAPQGVFAAVALKPELSSRFRSVGLRIAAQFAIEFAAALGLSLLLIAARIRSPMHAAALLGLTGLIAGVETHFPNWNWAGFPTSYLLAGTGYLAGNWLITGLLLGAIRRKLCANDDLDRPVRA